MFIIIIYLIIGFCIGSIGITLINNLNELLNVFSDWLKSIIAIKITQCNVAIDSLNNTSKEEFKNPIGFTTISEEEEDDK